MHERAHAVHLSRSDQPKKPAAKKTLSLQGHFYSLVPAAQQEYLHRASREEARLPATTQLPTAHHPAMLPLHASIFGLDDILSLLVVQRHHHDRTLVCEKTGPWGEAQRAPPIRFRPRTLAIPGTRNIFPPMPLRRKRRYVRRRSSGRFYTRAIVVAYQSALPMYRAPRPCAAGLPTKVAQRCSATESMIRPLSTPVARAWKPPVRARSRTSGTFVGDLKLRTRLEGNLSGGSEHFSRRHRSGKKVAIVVKIAQGHGSYVCVFVAVFSGQGFAASYRR